MNAVPEADGLYHLDDAKVTAEAAPLGSELTEWTLEERTTSLHPVQKAPDPSS
jgi:hypothetical protein